MVAAVDAARTAVALPGGAFTARQLSTRLEYALNSRAGILAFVQHHNEDHRLDFNLRVHWIPRIGDDVYVVWNSGYTTDPAAPHRFPAARALGRPLHGALVVKAVHRLTP